MKISRLLFFFAFLLFPLAGGANNYPIAKVTVQVVNQDGEPVKDAKILAGFYRGKEDLTAWPDENGLVSFSSPVLGDMVLINDTGDSPREAKYYTTLLRRFYQHPEENAKDGKWQPWDPTITMVLRERKHPIPMYATSAQYDMFPPREKDWIGFDMKICDWVSPDGKGKHADVELYVEKGEPLANGTRVHPIVKIRFSDPLAGCYWVEYSENQDVMTLRSPYQADLLQDYSIKELVLPEIHHSTGGTMRYEKNLFDDRALIFRTRTRVDADGNLLGAYYGKIQAPLLYVARMWRDGRVMIRFHYYLNPTENDPNIECDPSRNLLDKKMLSDPITP